MWNDDEELTIYFFFQVCDGALAGIASAVTNNCQGQTLWVSVANNQDWITKAIRDSGAPFDGPTGAPRETSEPTDPVLPGHRGYVIQPGDTLEKIAERTGVSLDQIVQFNRGRRFDVGVTLTIPPPPPSRQPPVQSQPPVQPPVFRPPLQSQPPFQPPVQPPQTSGRVHIVRPGDTMYSLARMYYPGQSTAVAANRIIAANGGRQSLSTGQEVIIP